MPRRELDGPRIDGSIQELGVPRKVIEAETGIHTSTLSRFFNAEQEIQQLQVYRIGVAVGKYIAKQTAK